MTIHRDTIPVRVEAVSDVTDRVKRFRLVPVGRDRLPSFSGGAHITVHLDGPERPLKNQYSLISPPGRDDAYEISVLRVDQSRGGSEFMHTRVVPGDQMWIGQPNNQFAIHDTARRHVLIAGGIGITPFMSMTHQLSTLGLEFELHYAMRSVAGGAYATALTDAYGDDVRVYASQQGERINLFEVLSNQPLGTHLYVCGPERLIEDALETARRGGWPESSLHWEKFLAPPSGDPFDVTLARSNRTVHVGRDESVLEAIEEAEVDAPYLCRAGVCGECRTRVLFCDGILEHHDEYLSEEEHQRGEDLMVCVSRFKGRSLTLDR